MRHNITAVKANAGRLREAADQALLDAPPKLSTPAGRRFGVCLAIGIWLALTAPADATFPGANGRIVFAKRSLTASGGSTSTLWTVDPGTGRTRQLTRVPSSCRAIEAWDDLAPAYSPSGRWIAFAHRDTCRAGERRGIYLMRADGTHRQLLVGARDLPATDPWAVQAFGYPAWSRDGRRLAFVSGVPDGPVLVVRARRKGPRRVAKLPFTGGGHISWGPARAIAFMRGDPEQGRVSLHLAHPDGGGRRRLPTGLAPEWSPDATRLAFHAVRRYIYGEDCDPAPSYIGPHASFDRSGQGGVRAVARLIPVDAEGCLAAAHTGSVYVVRADGRDLRRVTSPGVTGDSYRDHDVRHTATWSPDGKQLAFVRIHGSYQGGYRNDSLSTDIYAMPAAGGAKRILLKGSGAAGESITSLSWQALPRGSRAAARGSTGKPASAAARRHTKDRLGASNGRSDTDGMPTGLLVGLIATALLALATGLLALLRRYNGSSTAE